MPTVPKDAASVLLLRDAPGGGGIEVLMVRRHAGSDFAASMHVFPGGGVEDSDCGDEAAGLCSGMGLEEAMSLLPDAPSPARALGIMVAGIRETFEETGILLARDASGAVVDCRGEAAERFAAYRAEMKEGRLSFPAMVARENLKLALDRLTYFAHWITPEISPIRFDTRFFLAPAPPCQIAAQDNVEVTDHVWISPAEALERNERGGFAMLPPTMVNLMALKRFASAEEAISATAGQDVPVIAPQVAIEDGRVRLLMPGDPGYA